MWKKSIPSRIEKMVCGVLLPWIPVCLVGGLCILSLLVSCCTGNGSPQNPSTVCFWEMTWVQSEVNLQLIIFRKTHQTTEKDLNGHSAINEKQAEKATDYPSFYITLTESNKSLPVWPVSDIMDGLKSTSWSAVRNTPKNGWFTVMENSSLVGGGNHSL